jgi:hypothetical protein
MILLKVDELAALEATIAPALAELAE